MPHCHTPGVRVNADPDTPEPPEPVTRNPSLALRAGDFPYPIAFSTIFLNSASTRGVNGAGLKYARWEDSPS